MSQLTVLKTSLAETQAEAKTLELKLSKGELSEAEVTRYTELATDAVAKSTQITTLQKAMDDIASIETKTTNKMVIDPTSQEDVTLIQKDNTVTFDFDGNRDMSKKQHELIQTPAYARLLCKTLYGKGTMSNLTPDEAKQMQEGIASEGGFLVPAEVGGLVMSRKAAPTRIRAHVNEFTISKDRLEFPRHEYSADDVYSNAFRLTFTGETGTAASLTKPVFGTGTIPVFTALMQIPVTMDLLEDAPTLYKWLSTEINKSLEIGIENFIINGTGVGQPMGIIPSIGTGPNDIPSTNIGNPPAYANVLSWLNQIPEQYDDENTVVVMSKTSTWAQNVIGYTDAASRPIFNIGEGSSGMVGAREREISGYPIIFSAAMPALGANNFPMLQGQLSAYWLLRRIGTSIQVLTEVAAQQNQVVLLVRMRFGGDVVDARALRAGKQA